MVEGELTLKKTGTERSQLMSKIPCLQYYRAQVFYLQQKHGNYAELDFKSAVRRGLNEREIDAWEKVYGTISQDAFAKLVAMVEDLCCQYPGLFTS